jgi:hypothetical protein
MDVPAVKQEKTEFMVRVPNALSTVIDESFFKTLEERFVQVETELSDERAANARYIDANIKRGIAGSSTVSVEEMKLYAGELERLRERVKARESELDSSRAAVRALQEENMRLRDRLKINNKPKVVTKPANEAKFVTRRGTASELEKLYAYIEKNARGIDIRGRGWRVLVFERKGGHLAGTSYKEYMSPSGHKLRSMREVLTYLNLINDKCVATRGVDASYQEGNVQPVQGQSGAPASPTKVHDNASTEDTANETEVPASNVGTDASMVVSREQS